ncbi:tyrosine-protein phosphatase [Janibacter sp. YIM B02568]|jgi:protein tyrosine/serine phosphatase|uniref:tyrosine-protein phosphatase n=1 Tax=Janibacter endophyticus TaxID=2806261 RepID=UPI00195049C7|nr:tyrosine-protein phosphatase [Janibacter endophyticus]MBM6546675.1 tyrosine-protein phosphatase [Janibacter endophyticus]
MTRWIDLEGVVNMRDMGGLPTTHGRATQSGRLIRSDNLQDLTPASVTHLVDTLGVTDVVDLRSTLEHRITGEGPLRATSLTHHHHSLVVESDDDARTVDEALALRFEPDGSRGRPKPVRDADFWGRHYTGYVTRRPDSVGAALAAISRSPGGTIVHCAAGKDRTGTVVGMALSVAGVPDDAIVEDYVLSAERIERIIDRLIDVEPYRYSLPSHTIDEQRPKAESMAAVLTHLRDAHGGAEAWLRERGWREDDVARLRSRLLD